jgi:hypothetical protein
LNVENSPAKLTADPDRGGEFPRTVEPPDSLARDFQLPGNVIDRQDGRILAYHLRHLFGQEIQTAAGSMPEPKATVLGTAQFLEW